MIRRSFIKCASVLVLAAASGAVSSPAYAAPGDKARITALADVAFGTLNTASDQSVSENVCAYSTSATSSYSVTATGNGAGGAFILTAGSFQLPYEVSWAGTINQSSGTALTAGTSSPAFTSNASQQACSSGPSASATLTVIIRASALGSARAGSYTGTLQVTIAPQ